MRNLTDMLTDQEGDAELDAARDTAARVKGELQSLLAEIGAQAIENLGADSFGELGARYSALASELESAQAAQQAILQRREDERQAAERASSERRASMRQRLWNAAHDDGQAGAVQPETAKPDDAARTDAAKPAADPARTDAGLTAESAQPADGAPPAGAASTIDDAQPYGRAVSDADASPVESAAIAGDSTPSAAEAQPSNTDGAGSAPYAGASAQDGPDSEKERAESGPLDSLKHIVQDFAVRRGLITVTPPAPEQATASTAESPAQGEQSAVQPPKAETPFRRCPKCGRVVSEAMKFCGYCGAEVEQTAPQEPLICPVCGFENPYGTRYCGDCGIRLDVPAKKPLF